MDAMPILAGLILALDLLQAGLGGNAIEDILDLARRDMAITIAWEQPALRATCELACYGLCNLGKKDYGAWHLELGIDGWDMQVAFAEVYILGSDLSHLTYP